MSDLMKVFFSGVEEFAKTMQEHSISSTGNAPGNSELIKKVTALTERVEKLLFILEEKLGTAIEVKPAKGKRMMDIKKRIHDIIRKHPEGVRPPQLARILDTKVQNLYPHLKQSVQKKQIIKSPDGSYCPARARSSKNKKTKQG
ncbi:MAG: hypothetical protein U9N45_00570 [Gemmatimonadota bacterium]|nr:hypothetical protein [Gemmatimonadota bacterium]